MTDDWNEWQKAWQTGDGPLPDIRARVRRERRRALAANVVFWTLVALLAVFGVRAILQDSATARVAGAFLLAFCAAMGPLYALLQQGTWSVPASPRESLELLERRLRAEARIALLTRWGGVVVCAFTLALTAFVASSRPDGFRSGVTSLSLLLVVIVLAITWSAPAWARRLGARHAADLESWRRWLETQDIPTR